MWDLEGNKTNKQKFKIRLGYMVPENRNKQRIMESIVAIWNLEGDQK